MYAMIMMLVLPLATAAAGPAPDGDAILGVWNNEEKDAKIEIYRCDGKYCGKVAWLRDPNYPEGSKEGTPETPWLDHNNPDPARRKMPVMGLDIMRAFTYAGDNTWSGGTVYDPKNGRTYRGRMTLVAPDKLDMRGFVGIPLFGRTTTWTR